MPTTSKGVPRSKQAARENYNRLSRWYDLLAGASEAKYRQLGLEALAAQPGDQILELGYGTGHALIALSQQVGPGGAVYGVDLADEMARLSQERLDAQELADRVHLTVADGAWPPFCTNSFDGLFMSFTLDLFDNPEIELVMQTCWRLLRPAGRLAIVSLYRRTPPGLAEKIYEWFHQRMPVLIDCRPIRASQHARQAGFELSSVQHRSMWGLPVEILLASKPGPEGK